MTTPSPAPSDPPVRICLVALHALPVIDPTVRGAVGGTETRAWTIAQGLSARGDADVSFVVRQPGGSAPTTRHGVRILPRPDRLYALYESVGRCLERRSRFPWVAVRRWEAGLLWQVPVLGLSRLLGAGHRDPRKPETFYRQVEADVFGTFGVQSNSARVIASARADGRPVVLFIGSDGDLDERYATTSDYVSPYGDRAEVSRFILQNADEIVVQTDLQRQWLQDRFGREGFVLPNPFDLDAWDATAKRPLPPEFDDLPARFVLWVGRAEEVHKRPGLCLELARRCAEVTFLMVVNPRDRVVAERLHREKPANVRIVEQVPPDVMPVLFRRAAALVSTSCLEGFPNVFLQAAASGVPIGSLEVGAEFLQAAQCGVCTDGDLQQLADFVEQMWERAATGSPSVSPGRDYVRERHDVHHQMERLQQLLAAVVRRWSSVASG